MNWKWALYEQRRKTYKDKKIQLLWNFFEPPWKSHDCCVRVWSIVHVWPTERKLRIWLHACFIDSYTAIRLQISKLCHTGFLCPRKSFLGIYLIHYNPRERGNAKEWKNENNVKFVFSCKSSILRLIFDFLENCLLSNFTLYPCV